MKPMSAASRARPFARDAVRPAPQAALLGTLLAFALLLPLLFLANRAMPFFADDFCRALGLGAADAMRETLAEYRHWTGRLAVTFTTYLLLGDPRAPTPLFDLLNSAAFLALTGLLGFTVRRFLTGAAAELGAKSGLARFNETLFLALAIWWLPWSIGETALWTTGSIGYLWSAVLELLVIVLVLLARGPGTLLLLAPVAILAGGLLETLGLAVTLFLAGLCLLRWRAGRTIPWAPLLAHALGLLSTLAAPGNRARAATLPESNAWDRIAAVFDLAGRLFHPGWAIPLLLLALPALLARVPLGAALFPLRPSSSSSPPFASRASVWFLPLAALAYVLLHLALPPAAVTARLSFPASLLLAGFLFLLFLQRPRTCNSERGLAVGAILALLATAASAAPALENLRSIGQSWHEAALRQTGGEARVPYALFHDQPVWARGGALFVALSRDAKAPYNRCFARSYGLSSVTAEP
ncbi:DUF6056 family protein [Aureimonas ureilytica]|uniref:DUF6056 family protein n=1 Tax=Aureimonas ureilytica TaxID=401562 RepID=UPI003CE8AA38